MAWRNLADIVEKYVAKGTQLYIEGRLRTRSWDDQSGNKRYTTEILADNIQLLGRKSDNPATNGAGASHSTFAPGANAPAHQPSVMSGMAPAAPAPAAPAASTPAAPAPAAPRAIDPAALNQTEELPDDDLPF